MSPVGLDLTAYYCGVFQNCLYTPLENGLLPEGYFLLGDDALQSHLIISLYSTNNPGGFCFQLYNKIV